MRGDIPGVTIESFIGYFLPIVSVYLACWIFFSWRGLKKTKPISYWLILVISAAVVPYLVYLPFYQMPYMVGDDFYGFSFVRSIANGNFLDDVCYQEYPTYYPPLYHLFLGVLLWLFETPLLRFFIYIPILNIILVSVVAYVVVSKIKDKETGVIFILMILFISTPGVYYLIRGMRVSAGIHFVIVRAYELIAIILVILGVFFFSREKKQDTLLAGIIGGIITNLAIGIAVYYSLSLFVYAIIRAIKTGNYKIYLLRLIVIGFITFLLASLYIIPYLMSVVKNGSDSYHWIMTMLSDYDPYFVTFGLGFMGLTFILGVLGIISLPKSNFKLILVITLVILFVGRFHVYITKPVFNISYVPDLAYYALVFFLSFTGAIFLRDFPIKISFKKWTLQKLKMGHIFLACTFFLPILIWNPVSNECLYNSFNPIPEKIEKITDVINKETGKEDIVLASSEISPWVLLLTGRHLALSGDPWCSNPTARYSLRYKDFAEAFSSSDIEVIKNNINKWNLDVLVFVKDEMVWDNKEQKLIRKEKEEDIHWSFRAGSPDFGTFFRDPGLDVDVDKSIFGNNKYFIKLYEDEHYVVLRNK